MSVFGPAYVAAYDALYGGKDYERECDLIERVLRDAGGAPGARILDLGCGTGGHAIPLARRGYTVLGVDRAPEMVERATAKAAAELTAGRVEFRQGDLRSLDLGERFDAALMMFAVLGYQLEDADVAAALATARGHLVPGGLLVFDVWHGPAVLAQRPSERTRVVPTERGRLERTSSGELDEARNVCIVRFRVRELAGEDVVAETEEIHAMRYFFVPELERFLGRAGFELVEARDFEHPERPPDDGGWNALVLARAT